MANQKAKFRAAVKKAKSLYKTGRYKNFGAAVKAAYKKVGSTKFIERGEKKSARPARVYQVKRSATGRFKGVKKISGIRRAKRSPIARAKKAIEEKLGGAYVSYFKADTVKATKAARKRMTTYQKQLRSL